MKPPLVDDDYAVAIQLLLDGRNALKARVEELEAKLPTEYLVGAEYQRLWAMAVKERDEAREKLTHAMENIAAHVQLNDELQRIIDANGDTNEELQERLNLAEEVRDLARAASNRDLAASRGNSERAHQLHQEREKVKGQRDEAYLKIAYLEHAISSAPAAFGAGTAAYLNGWRKGVLDANDKLYAAQTSGIELTPAKIFELFNILLEHPPEVS